jgi:hypothetical protein
MKNFCSKRWLCIFLGVMASLAGLALLACWHWRIWSLQDFRAYQEVSEYPIGRDLWLGYIAPGQSMEKIKEIAPPHRTHRFGPFTELTYYPGGPPQPGGLPFSSLLVIARDGKLVHATAASCTWLRVFFAMNAEDNAEFSQCVKRFCEEMEKRRQ